MSHQPPSFYGRASTPRAVKQTTALHRSTGGQRPPLRLLNSNFEQGYQPGMYLPEQTVDENTVDSPLSDDLGGDLSEYTDRGQGYTYTTPTQSRRSMPFGDYSNRENVFTTPTQSNRHPDNRRRTPSTTAVEDMVSLLQSQPSVLNQLLRGQQALQEKTADLEKRFTELENRQASTPLSSSSSEEKVHGKRNRIVTSELSVSQYVYQ